MLEWTERDFRILRQAVKENRRIILERGATTIQTVPGGYPWGVDMLVRVTRYQPGMTRTQLFESVEDMRKRMEDKNGTSRIKRSS